MRVISNRQLGPSARLQILRDANGNSVKKFVKGSMAITPRLRNLPATAPTLMETSSAKTSNTTERLPTDGPSIPKTISKAI